MFRKLYIFGFIFLFGSFLCPIFASAKTTTSDLSVSASSSYTFDNTKIEFSGGNAHLKAATGWYNSSWGFRDQITITNYTGADLTNYPAKVSLTTTSVNFWSKVESNGASVRFTDSDGTTLINHYTQSFDFTGNTSTVWVKIPSLAAHSSTTIYLYYTNSGASDVSNGNNVFTFFDDFTTGGLDTSKWVMLDNYGVISVTGGSLLMDAYEGNVWHAVYATTTYAVDRANGLILEGDISTFNILNKDQNFEFGLKTTNASASALAMLSDFKYAFYINGGFFDGGPYGLFYNEGGTNTSISGTGAAVNTTYSFRLVVYPGGGADYFFKGGIYTDWTLVQRSSFAYSGSLEVGFDKQEGKYIVDNVRVRKLSMPAGTTSNVFPRYSTSTPVFTTTTASVFGNDQSIGEVDSLYENGMFKLWYSSSTSVAYATSSDGINWTRYASNPVFSPSGQVGTFDKTWANRQYIIKDSGIYYMYYNGFEAGQETTGKIGLATSTDGINWTRYANNPVLSPGTGWEATSLYNVAVVKVNSIWYMLYEGKGSGSDNTQILGMATSTDGINWTKYSGNPTIRKGFPFGTNYAAAPNLIYNNGKFYTWLMGNDVRGRYFLVRGESVDAINWTFFEAPDLFPQYPWEYISVSDESNPVEFGGSTYMYYLTGNQTGLSGGLGLMKYNGTLNSLIASSTSFKDATEVLVSTSSLYYSTSPSLTSPGVPYDKITAFSATTTGSGSVTFQISNDGASWYYWNGSAWVAASDSGQSNSSSTINTNIVAFSNAHPSGTFYWRAYLTSNGAQSISLTNVSVVTNVLPTVTIDAMSGYKNSAVTVTYKIIDPDNDTINFSQTATSGIEYSLDGNTWSDATASTTGDGLTGLTSTSSPGQAHTFVWDTLTDASTTESNTVYLRFRPNDGIDFATSWITSTVFGLDNVAPTAVGVPTFGTILSTSIEVVKPSVTTEGGSGLNQWQVRRDANTLSSAMSTSTTSTIVSGLSANTQYTFDVRFTDMVNSTSTFGSSTTKYTATNIPTLLSATVDNAIQITLTWSGDASQYYIENTTAGTNSSWQASTEKSFSGLNCGTTYTFRVKGRNAEQLETTWSSEVSATTNSCGGGSVASTPPSVPLSTLAVTLNNQKIETSSRLVTLNFSAVNAIQVAISEDPNFAGASWDTYAPTKSFTLSAGAGEKTIYVKFRSASGGVTATYKVNVTLKPDYVPSQVVTPAVSTSGEIITPVATAVAQFEVSNPDSKVIIAPVKTLVYKPNSVVKYTYSYKNETTKTVKVKVIRQVLNAKGKVMNQATGFRTLSKGKSFKFNATNVLGSKLTDGIYIIKVQIRDAKTAAVIDENSFDIIVKKPIPVVKKPIVKKK